MVFKKLLMLDFAEKTLEPQYWKRIGALCDGKVLLPRDSPQIGGNLDADCILVNFLPPVDKARIDAMPNLKYIGILATGYGRIDAAYAATKGIPVCNIPGYSTEAVAELTFGAVLEHIRELERAKGQARKGDYSEATFSGSEVKGKRFGVVGLGNIGKRVAEIAQGFGAEVRYWSKNRKLGYENKGIWYSELDALLEDSDIVSLNLMRNKETEGIIDAKRIKSLKRGSIFVNLAPMEMLDMDALDKRLAKGDITFILDHSDELPPERLKQFSRHKNCVIYPPIGYTTREATRNKQETFVSNLESFLNGKLTNRVN